MQSHPDFIFHVEEPREQPSATVPLRGWIATQQPVTEIRVSEQSGGPLTLLERPDVRTAFPNFPFAAGFSGEIKPRDLREGALHFSFAVGGVARTAVEALPPPPLPPPWLPRIWARLRRIVELQRLKLARKARPRWNAALAALLLEIKITRNSDFRRAEADRLLALFSEHFRDAVVVQIGANDGVAGDPLVELFARTRWTGLLVEPVSRLCEALASRYRDRPGVQVVQAAVSDRDGEAPLYRLRTSPGETPEWFHQLATLNREVLLQHRSSIPEIESLVVEERTPTVRFETLLARHHLAQIDLLVIDTEGHDYEILRDLDFARWKPIVLMFEHQHLAASDKASAYDLLRSEGYAYAETKEGDAIAWRRL